MRKICCNLLAYKGVWQICNLQAALDRIVIGDRHIIHAALEQLPVQLLRIGVAIWKIETTEQPFLRARTITRVDVKVAFTHA
jgi:hypothetical protein